MGIMEAILYSQKGSDAFPGNEHNYFTLDRFALLGVAVFPTHPLIACTAFLLFPLLHDGAYYYGRHLIEPSIYRDGWLSEPDAVNSAKVNFSLAYRVALAICGVVGLAVEIYFTFFH